MYFFPHFLSKHLILFLNNKVSNGNTFLRTASKKWCIIMILLSAFVWWEKAHFSNRKILLFSLLLQTITSITIHIKVWSSWKKWESSALRILTKQKEKKDLVLCLLIQVFLLFFHSYSLIVFLAYVHTQSLVSTQSFLSSLALNHQIRLSAYSSSPNLATLIGTLVTSWRNKCHCMATK